MLNRTSILLLVAFFISHNVYSEILDGKGIKMGGGKLSPTFLLKESYDNNLTNAPSSEIESFVTLVETDLLYEAETGKQKFLADYLISAAAHEGSGQDDYVDQKAQLGYRYTPIKKFESGILAEYFDSRDPRGTGAAEGTGAVQANPDEWHHFKFDVDAAYGGQSTKGRLEFDAGFIEKDYDNNRGTTAVRDREDITASSRFYYRVMPKTQLLFEGRFLQVNYDTDAAGASSIDSNTSRLLAGVTWEKTYKTTGRAQFGYIRKDFRADDRPTGEDFAWEFEVEWKPKSYSTFTIGTSRDFNETNGTGNFIIKDSVYGSWTHEWKERLSSRVNFNYAEDSFDQDTTGRSDDLISYGASLTYEMRRWLALEAGYSYDERDSNNNTFDYERDIGYISATVIF